MKLRELLELWKPLTNAKFARNTLLGVVSLAALLTWGEYKVEERYVELGGDINNPISNYEKIQYIYSQGTKTNNSTNYNK